MPPKHKMGLTFVSHLFSFCNRIKKKIKINVQNVRLIVEESVQNLLKHNGTLASNWYSTNFLKKKKPTQQNLPQFFLLKNLICNFEIVISQTVNKTSKKKLTKMLPLFLGWKWPYCLHWALLPAWCCHESSHLLRYLSMGLHKLTYCWKP